tara:strand:- start:23272 stop:23952 length:681 start_codon:yes stop_codon:yes gene_type:complete
LVLDKVTIMALVRKSGQQQPSLENASAGHEGDSEAVSPKPFQSLVEELSHGDPETRRWAAMDLARHDAADILGNAFPWETDASVREAMITSLASLANDTAAGHLASGLRSESASVRNECIDALRSMPKQCESVIPVLMLDPDSDLRILAVNILETLQHPSVEPWLIEILEHDPEVNVCGAALDVLTEVGTVQSLPAIDAVVERFFDEPFIEFGASLARDRIRGEHT